MVNSVSATGRRPSGCAIHRSKLARLRTYPQHTRAWLPLLRSRSGGVHRHYVVRSPKSDNLSKSGQAFEPVKNLFALRLRNKRITDNESRTRMDLFYFSR